ncbi:class II receptor tyrosine kinase-like isoform X2 [Dysidea avara]|uniref:class II receptor tyrosine kinase-like isoform X2 n=1 Tax=Dysidea avara TaxID=196820 RepID=UPI003319736E
MCTMANKVALLAVLLTLFVTSELTRGRLIEGIARPAGYVSFPPSTYDEGSYEVTHGIGKCNTRVARVGNHTKDVIICPYGELLLDGQIQTNLRGAINANRIRFFYTWEERTIPAMEAFVTLQFPGEAITPTKIVMYYLDMLKVRAHEPRSITLFSSTTESIYPEDEIQVDEMITEISSGISAQNGDYAYKKYEIQIPENRRVAMNYARISMEYEEMKWIFISEIEVYHLLQPMPTTTTTTTTNTSSSTIITQATAISSESSSSIVRTTSVVSTSTVTSTILLSRTSVAFSTPTFTFPSSDPFLLQVTTLLSDITINCTVTSVGDLSQLTTSWSHNGTGISNSDKYIVNDNHLTIRNFTRVDAGVYRCTVCHTFRWSSSRQYFIITNIDNSNIQRPEENDSSGGPPVVILAAVSAVGAGLLFCTISLICAIVCLRRKKRIKEKRKYNYCRQKSSKLVHSYENTKERVLTEGCKHSADNVYYEQMNINSLNNGDVQVKVSNPPTLPLIPTFFGKPKLNELPKPELPKPNNSDDYGFLDEYYQKIEMIPSFVDNNETSFDDIYDLTANPHVTQPPYSPQDIYYAAFDYNQNPDKLNTISSGLSICVPIYNDARPLKKDEAPNLFEWKNVCVKAKVGEGQFGDVFLAETVGINVAELGCTETKATRILVAIKTLKGDYSASLKQQFEKEIKFMTRLDNSNVIRLLGICSKGTPFIMMEYMKNGDLHMFLRKHYYPTMGQDSPEAEIQVDIPILLYIAIQIANGMKYLASYGFIHRDLAARNCLVGEEYTVKIADFGMTQNLYNSSYYVMQGVALVPIRWMAPESFFGRFSTKTDVWSYGVTLWEIFTLCRQQPYEEMNNEALMFDVQKEANRTLLKRPPIAPDEVYNTMKRCWIHDPVERIDFESVYDMLLDHYKLNY